ncbi:MAG: histidine kinase, partial [Actinomycetota bacterium]|nr:histidine kinase [Actinomycetota bacterium]
MTLPSAAGPPPVPVLLRWCLHLLVAGLLLLAVLRVLLGEGMSVAGVAVMAVVVGAVYAAGNRLSAVSRSRTAAGLWLAVLLACWLGLLFLTPDAIYLAFPWFFLLLHLLPRRPGLVAVALTTAAAIVGFGWHQKTFTAAMVIGPIIGAGVVIATVWGYQALQAESEQRRRLIEQLRQTRAELVAAERESGMLAERERLAREIHDTLAQGLSSIQLLLRAAGRSLQPATPQETGTDAGTAAAAAERAGTLVEQARHTAQDNLAEARRFVQALAPAALDESSLASALQRLCETTSQRAGIPVTFHQEGAPIPLPTPVEAALLRIAQSALGNTTQHAQATRARVTL